LEVRYANPAWKIGNAAIMLSGFYDAGHVKVNKVFNGVGQNNRNLQGAGFGLNVGSEGDFMVRSMLAWRLEKEKPLAEKDRTPRVWVQAVKWF
jgi:hemolysin activation/secretion protein